MTTSSNCCNIERREPDVEAEGVLWRHTGRYGYYLVIGSEPDRCFVSNLLTEYFDIYFGVPLHPHYYEQVWKDYEDLLQPCLKINQSRGINHD